MNLSTALKRKNRLVRELEDKKKLLIANNVQVGDNEPDYDAGDLRGSIITLVDKLVAMKSAISLANAPIQGKIYKISELKGLINLYSGLPTKHGTFAESVGYDGGFTDVSYKATIRRKVADMLVKGLQEEIDSLQDEIDAHNHSTQIEL